MFLGKRSEADPLGFVRSSLVRCADHHVVEPKVAACPRMTGGAFRADDA
ncbi:MAG: hypothetical protein VW777_17010 [Deltaproteobacteria bacterium]